MLQRIIDGNTEIYQQICRLEGEYQETGVEGMRECLSGISWGIDAPRKTYSALSTIYGALNSLYMSVYLRNILTPSGFYLDELSTIHATTRALENQLERYARYIQREGRDKI